MNTIYVPASIAYKKIENALDSNTAVYVYGATGYGKTRMLQEALKGRRVLWLSADGYWNLSALEEDGPKRPDCVVIDNLQLLEYENRKEDLQRILGRNDIWVALVGRMKTPAWMYEYIAIGRLLVISEENLRLSDKDLDCMAKAYGVTLTESVRNILKTQWEGNAFAISIALHRMQTKPQLDEELQQEIQNAFVEHLEKFIIPSWSLSLQEFLMKINVVEQFTLPMAVMITADDQAATMISAAQRAGNFLEVSGDTYALRPYLRIALKNIALKTMGLSAYQRYQANAGLYYETHGDIVNALHMYEVSDRHENIRELLIRNGRRNPGFGFFYELRRYYLSLPEKDVENSPILICALSMLYSMLMNAERSEYWFQRLEEYAKRESGPLSEEANELVRYLRVALPHRGYEGIFEELNRYHNRIFSKNVQVMEPSITNNEPSVINGAKDFCEWIKTGRLASEEISRAAEVLLGAAGRGLIHVMQCEGLFEQGASDADVVHLAMASQLDIEGGGKTELLFVPTGIHIRICMLGGVKANAVKLLDAYEKRVRDEKKNHLLPKIEALRCRMNLMFGNHEQVEEWLVTAPNELEEFCTLERYRYMTKVLYYIDSGKNKEAMSLLEKLRYYADYANRVYYRLETDLLTAIVKEREGLPWKEHFLRTLNEIYEYQFVRIITEKGAGIVSLLKAIRKEFLAQTSEEAVMWLQKVLAEAETVADKYPAYLGRKKAQPSDFGERSLIILRMQAEGYSLKEIAEKLNLAERTVKYHAAENYRKLNAKGKTDAVQIARSMNLI